MEHRQMRRKDREITDFQQIADILNRCNTIRLGIGGGEYPYVVPVSFGMETVDGKAVIYFHCAHQGLKVDLLELNKKVCVEADIFIRTEEITHGITARYESVIGFGECVFLTDTAEMVHGLKLICEHYGYADYQIDNCGSLQHVLVGKIVLEQISGKRNIKTE